MSRIKGGPESGDLSPAGLPEIPAWLPPQIIAALNASELGSLPKLIAQVPFGVRVPIERAVEEIIGGGGINPVNLSVQPSPARASTGALERLKSVEELYRLRMRIGTTPVEEVAAIGKTAPESSLAIRQSRTKNPALTALTQILAQPAMAEAPIKINGPNDLLVPQILDPLFKKGDRRALSAGFAQLPDGKPRQQAVGLILDQAIHRAATAPSKEKGGRAVSRAVQALMANDDTVDHESADNRPAFAYVTAALERLSEERPGAFQKVTGCLPTPVLIKLGFTGNLTAASLVSVMRTTTNELDRGRLDRYDRKRSGGGRRLPRSRREAYGEIADREEMEIGARFSAAVILAAAKETVAQDVIDGLVADESAYVIGNIYKLATSGDEEEEAAAKKLLRLNGKTQKMLTSLE